MYLDNLDELDQKDYPVTYRKMHVSPTQISVKKPAFPEWQ